MRAVFTDDPGMPDKRYTVSGNEGVSFGAFDTQEEVLEVIRCQPDGECTVRFGQTVSWEGPEAGELAKRIGEIRRERHAVGFEQYLADEWAIVRTDVYEEGILPLELLRACEPVRPSEAIKIIGISQERLIELLRSGRLGKPKKLGHGRVAWRFDEIAGAAEWVKDVRE